MKRFLKLLYSLLPSALLVNSRLSKYLHHKPIPKNVKSFTVKGSNIKLISDPSPLVRKTFWLGISGYEEDELRIWVQLCKNSKNIIEIGGNIGYFTLFGASKQISKNYKVYEPLPYNFNLLVKNLELNRLNHVQAENLAVVGKINSPTIKFHIPKDESSYEASVGGYVDNAEAINRYSNKSIEVDVISSENIFLNADLIKLDVEGSEYQILDAAKEDIICSEPILLIEMRKRTVNLRSWIFDLMRDHNYLCFVKSACINGVIEINLNDIKEIVLQEKFQTRDIFLCPRQKVNFLKSSITLSSKN